MRVQDVKTKAIREVNASYGARLIEQGKAVPVAAEKAPKAIRKNAAVKSEDDV